MKGTFQDILNSAELVIEAKSSGGREKETDRQIDTGEGEERERDT